MEVAEHVMDVDEGVNWQDFIPIGSEEELNFKMIIFFSILDRKGHLEWNAEEGIPGINHLLFTIDKGNDFLLRFPTISQFNNKIRKSKNKNSWGKIRKQLLEKISKKEYFSVTIELNWKEFKQIREQKKFIFLPGNLEKSKNFIFDIKNKKIPEAIMSEINQLENEHKIENSLKKIKLKKLDKKPETTTTVKKKFDKKKILTKKEENQEKLNYYYGTIVKNNKILLIIDYDCGTLKMPFFGTLLQFSNSQEQINNEFEQIIGEATAFEEKDQIFQWEIKKNMKKTFLIKNKKEKNLENSDNKFLLGKSAGVVFLKISETLLKNLKKYFAKFSQIPNSTLKKFDFIFIFYFIHFLFDELNPNLTENVSESRQKILNLKNMNFSNEFWNLLENKNSGNLPKTLGGEKNLNLVLKNAKIPLNPLGNYFWKIKYHLLKYPPPSAFLGSVPLPSDFIHSEAPFSYSIWFFFIQPAFFPLHAHFRVSLVENAQNFDFSARNSVPSPASPSVSWFLLFSPLFTPPAPSSSPFLLLSGSFSRFFPFAFSPPFLPSSRTANSNC